MSDVPRVLVVDDEENITYLVARALAMDGMEVETAATGHDALQRVVTWRPDAMVLDIMLPDLDGFTILRRLRDQGYLLPVLFLSARSRVEDRVRGLSDGGNDYLVKPFDVSELVARVRLRLRQPDTPSWNRRLRCADLEMDTDRHEVIRGGDLVHLSTTEYRLLHYLLVNAGRILSRSQILDQVWSYDFDGDPSIVDTYISYLRRKIDDRTPRLLHTVRGVGWCLRSDA